MDMSGSDDHSLIGRIAQMKPGEVIRVEAPQAGSPVPAFVVIRADDFDLLTRAAAVRMQGEAANGGWGEDAPDAR